MESDQFKAANEIMKIITDLTLEKFENKWNLEILISLPHYSKRELYKRQDTTVKQIPYGYFSTETLCQTTTNNCTSKGKCLKTIRSETDTLFYCECDKDFAGVGCELEDIHSDFHLIFWTTLVMIIILVYVIGFVLSMETGRPGSSSSAYSHAKTD
jgi:hypothetical protein